MMQDYQPYQIKKLLEGKLPGKEAQYRMAPEGRQREVHQPNNKKAGVMLLLYHDGRSIRTVFIKRNQYNGPHSAQISFPGGMFEIEDKDLKDTALRETEEETGIDRQNIEVLGALTKLYIPVSNFCVQPFVGWYKGIPEFNPDSIEVQYLVLTTLAALTNPDRKKLGIIETGDHQINTPYFDIENEVIWGATAMILNEFIELLVF